MTCSIRLVLSWYKNSSGLNNIKLRITHNRKVRYISTQFYVAVTDFNPDKEEVRRSVVNSTKINASLKRFKFQAWDKITEIVNINTLHIDDIVSAISGDDNNSLVVFYNEYVFKDLKTDGNRAAYNAAMNRFVLFVGEDVMIKHITRQTIQKFINHLRTEGIKENSIAMYLRHLRAVCNKAIQYNIVDYNWYPFRGLKVAQEKTLSRSISIKEICALFNYYNTKSDYKLSLDVFFLSFFLAGMNIVDIFGLKFALTDTHIQYKRAKTGKVITIPIHDKAREIMSKYYSYDTNSLSFNYAIANNLNKAVNKGLESVCKELNLQRITTYYARHSWAMIAYNDLNIQRDIISSALGHSDSSITSIYARTMQNIIDDAVLKMCDIIK